ncbi:MAG TPA: radical SAM protein [Candidatus Polarisedimenticolia bacterium]|nr:radical SAM protein [Candidatus Polarisedimenticolia bacterium]
MANALEQITTRNWNRAVPMSALFELTFVCNHACSFCYNCPTGQKEMTTQEVFDALRKLADFNILYLTLSGGEPLVRRDFFDIARRARELGFALRIYTNAYLIDEAMAKKIKEIANPVEMEISIHGAKPETHERLTCVPGSLQRVIDAVRHLRAQGIKVNLKCPVTRDNQDEVLDVYNLAIGLGATIVFDPVITPRDDGDKDPLSLMASDDFLRRYWTDDAYAGPRQELVPKPRNEAGIEAVCGTGRSSFAIDPYGNIYPCVQWRRKAGNIKELDRLHDMWRNSPVLIEVRKTAVEMTGKLQGEHKSGGAGGFCNFCLGVADLQTGDPMSLYPQTLKNAEFRKQAYESWKAKTGETVEDTGGVLTKCSM